MSVDERREWLKQLREWKKQLCAGVNPPSEIRQELFNFGSCYDDWYLENRVDDDGDDLGGDVIPSKNQHEGDPSGRSRDENQGD